MQDLLQLTDDTVNRDIRSVGRIATEIFTAHLNMAAVFSSIKTTQPELNQSISKLVELLGSREVLESFDLIDATQKEFLYSSLNPSQLINHSHLIDKKSYKYKTKLISDCQLINEIYSLKVLSVYSLLLYFQDKHFKNDLNSSGGSSSDELNDHDMGNFFSNSNFKFKDFLRPKRTKDILSRKVSLNSFTNIFTVPKNFHAILDDIQLGCFPRLYNKTGTHNISYASFKQSFNMLKSIPSVISMSHLEHVNGENKAESRKNNSNSTRFLEIPSTKSSSDGSVSTKTPNTKTNDDLLVEIKNEQANITGGSNDSNSLGKIQIEKRRVKFNKCSLVKCDQDDDKYKIELKIKFDDNLNRVIDCLISVADLFPSDLTSETCETPYAKTDLNVSNACLLLTDELVDHGLVNSDDRDIILNTMKKSFMLSV